MIFFSSSWKWAVQYELGDYLLTRKSDTGSHIQVSRNPYLGTLVSTQILVKNIEETHRCYYCWCWSWACARGGVARASRAARAARAARARREAGWPRPAAC